MRVAPEPRSWRERLADAVRHNAAGRPVLAERAFTRLLRDIAGSPDAEDPATVVVRARAHLGRAACTVDRRGDLVRALEDIDAAAGLARAAGADHVLAAVHGQRALVALSMGRTADALDAFDAAVELLDQAEPYDRMCILLNRGALHLERGTLGPARRDLSRCVALAVAAGDRVLEFKARHNLGYVEFLAGNLPRALAEMAAAADLDAGGPWPTALLDQARVLREAGLIGEAEVTLRAAEDLYRRDGVVQGVAETLLARAECALTTSPEAARALAADARRRFRRRGNARWERRAEHLLLVAGLALTTSGGAAPRGRLRTLARHADEIAATCAQEGREDLERSARLVAATARLAAGEQVGDVPDLRRGDPFGTRLQAREVRARAARAAGDGRTARAEVRAGLEEVCAYQARFGSLDMRTASAVHGVALARLDLDLALETGRAATVFASLERTRAASSRLTPVRPPADEAEAALLSELRLVEEEARTLEGSADAAARARLDTRAADLRAAVRAGAWRREGTRERGAVRAAAPLDEVRAHVAAAGCTLVSVAVHRDQLHAVVVGERRLSHHMLGDARVVDELVHRTRSDLDVLALPMIPAPVRPTVTRSLLENLRRLDELLVAPLRLTDAPLVLCPSGLLGVLPWGMLPSRRGLPVVVTPSTSGWHAAADGRGTPAGRQPRVAAIAGPGLGRGVDEAQAIAARWGGTALPSASTASAAEALGGHDLVHVAAHGRHEADNPFFSSVRLADGPLFAHELESVERMAECLVLSACEVGQWTVRPGNEPLGLTTALLQLGARCVVAGVARVGDDAAAEVMVRMHDLMATGSDTASALATAQAEAADDDVVAPFVCFGAAWTASAS